MKKQKLYCGPEEICEIYIADTFLSRFSGYMFQKQPRHQALLIKPCDSIHTFFMRFPIDVLFLVENMTVVKKLENLPRGKVVMPVKKACMVLESRAGGFEKVVEGMRLRVE